jgi:hypothetical protein
MSQLTVRNQLLILLKFKLFCISTFVLLISIVIIIELAVDYTIKSTSIYTRIVWSLMVSISKHSFSLPLAISPISNVLSHQTPGSMELVN